MSLKVGNDYTMSMVKGDDDTCDITLVYEGTNPPVPYVFKEGERVTFNMRQLPGVGQALEKECPIDLVANKAVLHFVNADTKDLMPTEYTYWLKFYSQDEKRNTFLAKKKFILIDED